MLLKVKWIQQSVLVFGNECKSLQLRRWTNSKLPNFFLLADFPFNKTVPVYEIWAQWFDTPALQVAETPPAGNLSYNLLKQSKGEFLCMLMALSVSTLWCLPWVMFWAMPHFTMLNSQIHCSILNFTVTWTFKSKYTPKTIHACIELDVNELAGRLK